MSAAWWLSGLLLGLALGAGYVSWLFRGERDERQAKSVELWRAARRWQQRFVYAERARMAERDRADRAEAAPRRDVTL